MKWTIFHSYLSYLIVAEVITITATFTNRKKRKVDRQIEIRFLGCELLKRKFHELCH